MNHCISMATLGSKGQETTHVGTEKKAGPQGTSRVPIWCWNLSVYDRITLRHRLQYEGNDERGSRTDHSLKDKIEENRALPQRTPAMNFPWVGKLDDVIHVTVDADWVGDPKDKVLHVRRSVGNRSVLHCSTLVCDTGNCIDIFS